MAHSSRILKQKLLDAEEKYLPDFIHKKLACVQDFLLLFCRKITLLQGVAYAVVK